MKAAENIVILPHVSADGDALGSSLALALTLRKLGRKATVCLEEDIPHIYSFLPGVEMAQNRSVETSDFDLAIALDTGDLNRLGEREGLFNKAGTTVNIDHHTTNSRFAAYNYVHTTASAVGEIIYHIIRMMGLDLDDKVSTCLYVAIATDTGGFRYSNTTSVTHQITSDLISNGVNVAEVSQRIFETTSLGKVKLLGEAINSLELLDDGRVAFITVTDEVIKKTGAKEEDSDGIVNIARNIAGVEVAAMFRCKGGQVKVNLRSSSYVDVSAIAVRLGGGGHKRASGCTIEGEINEVMHRVLDSVREVL